MKKTSSFNSTQTHKEQQSLSQRTDGSMQERIRRRAYELYEKRGRRDGHHEEDWAQAEEQIRGEHDFDKAA
jgi:Protein of unknown function (DUF2934)